MDERIPQTLLALTVLFIAIYFVTGDVLDVLGVQERTSIFFIIKIALSFFGFLTAILLIKDALSKE